MEVQDSSNIIKKKFKLFSSNLAIIDENNNEITYNDLNNYSNLFSSLFNYKSLVFLLCENKLGSIISYFSLITNHQVPLLLNSDIDAKMLVELLVFYKPNFLIIPREKKEFLKYGVKIYEIYDFYVLKLDFNQIQIYDNLCLLLSTSGSTGSPKFARISYENIISNAESISTYLNLTESERPITSLPMNYSYGLSVINSHIISGSTVLLTSKSILEKDFWNFFNDYKATSLSGVPYTFDILNKLRFFRKDNSNLKTLTQAGGRLNEELKKIIFDYSEKFKKKFYVMYGQTEASPRISYVPYKNLGEKINSIGIPIPDGEIALKDNDNQIINEAFKTGQLVYSGKNVFLGYAKSKIDLKKEDENNGILETGDLAYRDSDNFYFITGRMKRFLKIFGNRINLDDVEKLINNEFCECACSGQDNMLKIYITKSSFFDEIKKFLISKINLHFSAFEIITVKEIPRNNYGKILYSKLNEK